MLGHSVVMISWITDCLSSLTALFFSSSATMSSHTEKEKRVKSGSDREGASNSQSDSSASLGSLKEGGESCHPLSNLSHPLSLSVSLFFSLCHSCHTLRGRKSVQPLVKGWPILKLQVIWQQCASSCRLVSLTSTQHTASDIFGWLCTVWW